jgi:penicillin amidase
MARLLIRRGLLALGVLVGVVVLIAAGFAFRVGWAARTGVAAADGTRSGIPVEGPVTIARDERGVPHIRAGSVHDLMVAEGYAMGSDRLFQIDLSRRYVDGRLAEVLGSPVARVDRRMRRYGIRELAAQVFAHASLEERAMLTAFADGINAAAVHEPEPPEYAFLFARFEHWQPEDALAVGFATVLDLDDRPDDVVTRDQVRRALGDAGIDALYPLTDPKYDVPTNNRPPGPIATLPPLRGVRPGTTTALRQAQDDNRGGAHASADGDVANASGPNHVILSLSKGGGGAEERAPIGSNAWAVGADRVTTGRAVLANDPHLDIGIPGIWYLLEGSAPGMHVGGAALAGTPGVTLGHNEHLAWGVTAGETAAMRVTRVQARGADEFFEHGRWTHARHRHERISVRFGGTIDADILETAHGVVIARGEQGGDAYVMDWRFRRVPASPLAPFLALQRARTAADGVAAMRALPEPALNVLLADDTGRVAYHFAGQVPMESSWGRWAADETAPEPAYLSYDRAAHVDPSRSAVIVTGNNRADGAGSPRLAPFWPPPYRAFEVRRALRAAADAGGKLSPDSIAEEQRDANSPAEREFAGLVLAAAGRRHAERDAALAPMLDALRAYDGTMVPESRGATAVVALRREMLTMLAEAHLPPKLAAKFPPSSPGFEIVLRALRERPRGWVVRDDYDGFVTDALHRTQPRLGGTPATFGEYAAQPLLHPLAAFGFSGWNGPTLPGRGGSFAPAVQWNGHAQSFRAVWIAGDWEHGTIDIASGESGEPGSPHYHDQSDDWIHFARNALPFSDAAVRATTRSTLTLSQ